MKDSSLEQVKKYPHGKHPNSIKNLKPFKPGENGISPGQGYSLTSALKHSLDKPLKEPLEDAPVRDHIVFATLQGALERETTPLNTVWDRADGKLIDKHAVLGEITIRIVEDEE